MTYKFSKIREVKKMEAGNAGGANSVGRGRIALSVKIKKTGSGLFPPDFLR